MSDFKFNKCDDYTIILTNRSYVPYGHIANYKVDDINFKQNMNSADEFSFTVYKYMTLEDGTEYEEPLWNKITDFKLIHVVETNTYYEIKVSGTDALATYKTIEATSLCEAELSQYNLYTIEINTEDDIARDDYVQPTIFYRSLDGLEIGSDAYNVAKNSSLLHRILWGSGKAKNYTIKHVDESIANLQRTFSIDGQSIYDFLTGDCAEQFNCLFVFDSTDRSISVYDLYSVCMNDDCSYRLNDKDNPNHLRYRGDFKDVCPKCGSEHIKVYGEDTMVFIDKENLTDEISFSTNANELKNCFHLKAGDDDMTAAVINLNPNGTSYLYYVSDYQKEDMSQNLVDKINSYDKLYTSYTDEYEQLMLDMYTAIDWELYYMDEMMPGAIPPDKRESAGNTEIVTKPVETAEQQIPKLSVNNLNYTAVSSVTSSTSLSTVESAIKNYVKVFVNTFKFKIETIDDSLGSVYQSGGNNCVKWTGKFKVTNFSDKEDVATSSSITLIIYDNYEEFVNQKIKKSIATDDSTGSIYDVLKIDDLGKYKEAIKLYGIVRLQSFIESIKNVEDILIQQGNQAQELYYGKYHNMEIATEKELDARQVQYDTWVDKETKCSTRKSEIQEVLNFENYLGSELYSEFCAYRRDQDYSNDNYISDGLNNTDLFSNAREFIKTAQEELKKTATLQCNISCKVKNLFALDEFKPFWDKFQIGNWITVGYDNEYYRLRVISINGSLSDFSNIDVEFSSVTRISDVTTNIKDVLNQAQSMATNYSYISRQSNNGQKANDTLSDFQKKSINAALYMIKNNDEEGITIDNHGITARAWNDILGDFDPEQLIITHNVLGFTDDNFASLKTALGKILAPDGTYKYGLNAEVVCGTFLLGKYLELENENGSLKFNGDGFVITNGKNTFTVNPNNKDKLLSISSNGSDIFYLDANGKLHIQGEGAGLDISSNQTITGLNNSIDGLSDSLDSEIKNREDADKAITETTTKLDTRITETAKEIKLEASKTYYTKESATSDFANADLNAKNYANSAESNANSATNNKLKDYSTTKQMNAALSLTAEGIKQTVSETYSTKDETNQLSSTISQTAGAIEAEITRAQGAEGALSTRITATESGLSSKVSSGNVVSEINQSAEQITLSGNRLVVDSNNFQLDSDGNVYIVQSLGFKESSYGDNTEIIGLSGRGTPLLQNIRIDLNSVKDQDGDTIGGTADYATNAGHAEEADKSTYAIRSSHADEADQASNATNARYASQADSASTASHASSAARAENSTSNSHTANCFLTDALTIYKVPSGSSRRFKTDISSEINENLDPHKLYDLNIVQFKYKPSFYGLPDGTPMGTVIGIIAEDVADKYPCAAEYDDDTGQVINWMERYLLPPMLALIQEQHKQIESLEQENKELNEKLESYESRLSKLEEQNKLILEKLNSLGISL